MLDDEQAGVMVEERYPGERKGLRLFLQDLLAALDRRAEPQALLRQAIRRALAQGELHRLRHARQIFNHLPRAQRQALSAGMLGPRARSVPCREDMLEELSRREPVATVCFETPRAADAQRAISVELRHELAADLPVRVMIEPGTLPSVAADTLRRIAGMIEADRRLLSARFWEEEPGALEKEQRELR